MNELTPLSQEEQHQLANPTFPIMQQLKAGAKGHTVFSAKGTLDYDKLDISEFVYAFLEFIQQQPQSHHKNLLQFLQLLMEKAMNYWWSSVRNFNLSINLQAFAQGRLTWGQMDVIQARSNTFFIMLIFVPVRMWDQSFQVYTLTTRRPPERAERFVLYWLELYSQMLL